MKGKQFAYSFLGTVIRAVILVVLAILLLKLGGKAYEFGFRIFTEEPMSEAPGREVQITVSKSDGIKEVSKMLEEKGLIRDATLFRIQEKVSLYDGEIHPGIFTLNTSMTAEEMFEVLLKTDEEPEGEEDKKKDDGITFQPPAEETEEPLDQQPVEETEGAEQAPDDAQEEEEPN